MKKKPRICGTAGGVNKRGEPCRVTLNLSAEGLCIQHDPKRLKERTHLHSLGGRLQGHKIKKAKAKLAQHHGMPDAPTTVAEAEVFASWVVGAVVTGLIDPRIAREATAALREFRSASEKRVLMDEITQLRTELKAAKGRKAS